VSDVPELIRREVVEQIAALLSRLDLPARIAIDGPDAAGKTTLADEVEKLLGEPVVRISGDAFLRPQRERYRRGRESPEGYYEDSFDHAALRASIAAATGLVIVDGVFLFRPELDDLWSFRLFVQISEEESLRRGARRDRALHPSHAAAEHLYRVRYLPAQRMYEARVRARDRADIVLVNETPAAPRLIVRKGELPPGA
jgi:uridine kinase